MLVVATFTILLLIICIKCFKRQKHWKERNVRYVKPWPFFGYMAPTVFRLKSFAQVTQAVYNTFPEQRYFGCYQFLTPILMIRDPDLIKEVMVNNFSSFPQHKNFIDADTDPIWAKNLFAMKGGDEWRDRKSLLSPMFTSRNLKLLFKFMAECANNVTQHYCKSATIAEVEMKDVASRFANDVIASTVFGINCNSTEDPNNEFYCTTKEVTNVSVAKMFKFFVYTVSPRLAKFMNFRIFNPEHKTFYENIISEAIKNRTEKQVNRPDMIDLLIEARKGGFRNEDNLPEEYCCPTTECEDVESPRPNKTEISDDDIIAQAIIFFFAGFDTVSTAISHLIYELALNTDIQQKLRQEIDQVKEDMSYDCLVKMEYLDMVVSETLRKWPSTAVNDRECVLPFTIEPLHPWETALNIEPKTLCGIPIFAIQRDAKIYPNPEKFDPERFSDNNKHAIKPYTYLPFGAGPRSCVGSRFALLEIKTLVFFVVGAFEIVRTEKTVEILTFNRSTINLISDNGFWVGLKPRA